MNACPICLESGGEVGGYHAECLQVLFGSSAVAPRVREASRELTEGPFVEVGRGSISGAQPKMLVSRSDDGRFLELTGRGGLYILKPQTASFRALPENEHAVMTIARKMGLEVPPCGLVRLGDGGWGYVVRRFDRSADGGRRAMQEDFCALAGLSADQKYQGSIELCVRLLRAHVEPRELPDQVGRLFRQVLFSWWIGNGDLHLKNLSLTRGPEGLVRLTPAYDLVSTELVIEGDDFALTLGGKRSRFKRADWLGFARYAGVQGAEVELARLCEGEAAARSIIDRSFLPADMKERLAVLLAQRSGQLRG